MVAMAIAALSQPLMNEFHRLAIAQQENMAVWQTPERAHPRDRGLCQVPTTQPTSNRLKESLLAVSVIELATGESFIKLI